MLIGNGVVTKLDGEISLGLPHITSLLLSDACKGGNQSDMPSIEDTIYSVVQKFQIYRMEVEWMILSQY